MRFPQQNGHILPRPAMVQPPVNANMPTVSNQLLGTSLLNINGSTDLEIFIKLDVYVCTLKSF